MSAFGVEHDLGYFGNLWVKQNSYVAGSTRTGHTHEFDHISLLAKGVVRVHVKGVEPKVFSAPTFIVIKKDHEHHFEVIEDATWYCVFAVKGKEYDFDLFGEKNDPIGNGSEGYAEAAPKIDALTKESDDHV